MSLFHILIKLEYDFETESSKLTKCPAKFHTDELLNLVIFTAYEYS